jgi:hypothetical protein
MFGFIGTSVTISFNFNDYSAIAVLHNLQLTVTHALWFSVFTILLLITELKQSHWTKSCNHTLNLHRPTSNSLSPTNFPWLYPTENWICNADCLQDNSSARTTQKTQSPIFKKTCLQLRCLAVDVALFRAFASAGTSLPRRCLVMGVHVVIWSLFNPTRAKCHKISTCTRINIAELT